MRQRGFTLVEVLVALLILTLVITTSLAAFVERTRRLREANEIVLAYQALANEAEYRRRTDFAAVTPSLTFLSDTKLLTPLEPFATEVDVATPKPGVKNVTLIVRWQHGERQAKLGIVRVDTGGSPLW
jgi:prepilin-type N-terminal cleavage/methylation domain-containing protein